jgi:hypothetical protein
MKFMFCRVLTIVFICLAGLAAPQAVSAQEG